MGRGGAGDELVVGEIEDTEAGESSNPAVGAGVHRHVGGGEELEIGDAVAELDGLDPPADILEERLVKDDLPDALRSKCGCPALCCKHPVREEPPGGDHSRRVQQFPSQGGKLLLCSGFPLKPFVKEEEEGLTLLGGEGDGIVVQIVFQAEGGALRGWGDKVTGRGGQGNAEELAQLDELRELEAGQTRRGHRDGDVDVGD